MQRTGVERESQVMINQLRRGPSELATWLGGLPSVWYRGLCSCCTVLAVLLVYIQFVMPALESYHELSGAAQAVKEYEEYRRALLVRLDRHGKDALLLYGSAERGTAATGGNHLSLEMIHRIAGEAGVSIVTLMREGGGEVLKSTGDFEYHLATRGQFARHARFFRSLSQDRVGVRVASVMLENDKWPEFDGYLSARFTLAPAETP
jgi:hypothetical protein